MSNLPASMSKLNAAQRAAVEHDQGPLLVLAGAGSGKTRVIPHRIARLMERGVRPESILAVSFTNKAAMEMGERMAELVGKDRAGKLWLSTFHSFGVRFLAEETKDKFVIFDQGDTLGLVRDILRREGIGDRKLDAAAILARISLWKNAFLEPEEVPDRDFEYDAVAREAYPHYEAALRSMKAVDFDDLVVRPARMLRDRADLRGKWRQRFRHLLIDEFQDTNRSQLELVRLLANELSNVCVVGDDDQSIYGWRGADVGNILDFERHFPGTTVVKLEDNYRSHSPILDVANSAIAQSTQKRHLKTLRAARGPGTPVRMCVVEDPAAEAKMVAKEIRDLSRKGRTFADMAVLYRSNLQARLLEEELRAEHVPYRMVGGTQFYDRKEIKDAAAYLRVVVYPFDELSLRRVVNYPPRGIGATSLERMAAFAQDNRLPLSRALGLASRIDGLPSPAQQSAEHLHGLLQTARARFRSGTSLAQTALWLFEQVGLRDDITREGGTTAARRWDNIQFLLRSIERYEQSEAEDKPSLGAFLQRITMRFEREEEEAKNRVTLSTLHAAKGLEFPVVFLIGCVEGQLPHSRTTDPKLNEAAPTDVEEERRLFYVGVTRARDQLYLTRARRRSMRGKVIPLTPSRFLDGLPEDRIEEYTRPAEEAVAPDEAADMASAILAQLRGD